MYSVGNPKLQNKQKNPEMGYEGVYLGLKLIWGGILVWRCGGIGVSSLKYIKDKIVEYSNKLSDFMIVITFQKL